MVTDCESTCDVRTVIKFTPPIIRSEIQVSQFVRENKVNIDTYMDEILENRANADKSNCVKLLPLRSLSFNARPVSLSITCKQRQEEKNHGRNIHKK